MRMRFAPSPEAPRTARKAVAGLGHAVGPDCLGALESVVAELVSLSVSMESMEPIDIRVDVGAAEVFGVMTDAGAAARAVRTRERSEARTIAVRIVSAIVSDWGPTAEGDGLWFRMP